MLGVPQYPKLCSVASPLQWDGCPMVKKEPSQRGAHVIKKPLLTETAKQHPHQWHLRRDSLGFGLCAVVNVDSSTTVYLEPGMEARCYCTQRVPSVKPGVPAEGRFLANLYLFNLGALKAGGEFQLLGGRQPCTLESGWLQPWIGECPPTGFVLTWIFL